MLKKLFLSFFVFLILTFSFVPLAHAQGTWYSQDFLEWYGKVYDSDTQSEIFGERYTAAQVQWVVYGLIAFIIRIPGNDAALECLLQPGIDIGDCVEVVGDAIDKLLPGNNGEQSSVMHMFTMRPISGITYFKDTLTRLKIIPSAYAQENGGFGFSAATPVQQVWRVSRDFTYLLMVLAVIVLAFMIMFRVKISPQVVISVQSALPKIAIALVLITFSYAIAGLLIDLMYVAMGLIALFVQQSGLSHLGSIEIFNRLTQWNILAMLTYYYLTFVMATVFSIGTGGGVAGFFLYIFAVIAIFIMIWFFFKIVFLLLKTYLMIMISVIVAPFQILLGTLSPGAGGFGPWIRTIISHLAVYPLVAVLFMLAFFFVRGSMSNPVHSLEAQFANPYGFDAATLQGAPWDPPFTFGTVSGSGILWIVLSFGIIALIPKAAEILQGLVSGKPFAYGTAVGEAVGAPGRMVGYGLKAIEVGKVVAPSWFQRFGPQAQGAPAKGAPSKEVGVSAKATAPPLES